MLRIGICDDEAISREKLYLTLDPLLAEDEQVIYEFSNGLNAVSWLKKHPGEMELLFLDVEMEPLSGIETAEQIRAFDKEIFLVFVTGHEEFAANGYHVNASDYVLKPAKRERLQAVLEFVRREIDSRNGEVLAFRGPDGIYQIPFARIDYLYSERRRVHVVSMGTDIAFYGKLSEAERSLPHRFVRIHNRYIVNTDHVEKIAGNKVWAAGKELPISRAMRQDAVAAFARLILE